MYNKEKYVRKEEKQCICGRYPVPGLVNSLRVRLPIPQPSTTTIDNTNTNVTTNWIIVIIYGCNPLMLMFANLKHTTPIGI
jgi:hypothetical protein